MAARHILLLVSLISLLLLIPTASHAAPHSTYSGFAEPEAFTLPTEYTFSSTADTDTISLTINDDYIYRYAFISYSGQSWQQVDLTGSLSTHYITDSATATITIDAADFGLASPGQTVTRNYIVTYTCDSSFQCHDGWQIWQFDAILSGTAEETIELECEDGNLFGNMQFDTSVISDPPCGQGWIEAAPGTPNFYWYSTDPVMPEDRVEFPVTLTKGGTYYGYVRMASSSTSEDALYAGFSSDDLRRFYPNTTTYPYDLSWTWASGTTSNPQRLVFEDMTPGDYTFIIGHGEAGARCDKIVLTTDPSLDCSTDIPCESWRTDLVSWWKLDGNADDSVGDNHGTVNGATPAGTGCKSGQCYSFDGTDDYVDLGNGLGLKDDFTISAWVNPRETITYKGIYSRGVQTASDLGLFLTLTNGGDIWAYYGNGADSTNLYHSDSYTVNTWQHLAVTKSGTTLTVYRNGVGTSAQGVSGDVAYSGSATAIGKGYTTGYYFSGSIDEVMIWDRALNANEVGSLYNSFVECTPDCAGRVCGPDPVCGQSCGTCPTGTCDSTGQCVVSATCSDGIQNGDETGVDCGGTCPACSTGHTYYVSNSGSDSNSGLSDAQAWAHHPWMSTWTGSVVLAPGDTVLMKRGDSWIHSTSGNYMTVGQSGTPGNYITTSAYGTGADPLIRHTYSSGSLYSVVYAAGKSYLVFDNLHIQHSSSTYGSGMGFYLYSVPSPCHDITFTNCEIDNIPHSAIYSYYDSYNITVGDITATEIATTTSYSNHIHDFGYAGVALMGTNPETGISNFKYYYNYVHDAKRTVAGENEYGLYFSVSSASHAYPTHSIMRYNNIQNILTWEALDIHGGSYIYFQDNYIKNFGFVGIHAGMGPRLTPTMDHIYIERNIIEQPTSGWAPGRESAFIIYWNTEDPSISSDIFIRNNTMFYTSRPSTGKFNAIRVNGVNGLTISGNTIYNGATTSGAAAISLHSSLPYGNKNVIITDNFIKEWGPGISLDGPTITGELAITNNIITKSPGHGVYLYNGNVPSDGDVTLYNNDFLGTSSYNFYSAYGIDAGGSLIAKNNIMARSAAGAMYYWYWGGTTSGTFTCDNNLYHNSISASPFYYGGSARNWAYWTGTLGFDTHGQGVSVNPLFENSGGSYSQDTDFMLQSTSPAINAGTDTGLTEDYIGNPIIGLPDIGAFEYQG